MANPKLKIGLGRIIKKVEAMPVETKFAMISFYHCVLGKVIFKGQYWGDEQARVLKNRFDINRKHSMRLFVSQKDGNYTDEQWKVIRLFTDDIGEEVLRDEWLALAKEQYNSMEG